MNVARLTEFAEGSGPTLAPYWDHNGFNQHERLRADVREIIAENIRLSQAVVSAILPSLLSPDENAVLVEFVRALPKGAL